MNKARLVSLVLVLGLALALGGAPSLKHAETASIQPSWEILEGEPNSCSLSSGGFGITAAVNNPASASEQGQFVVPGYGQVGETHDTNFAGILPSISFFVFVSTPYSVPAHTPVTLTVTTYNLPNYAGGVSYVSTMTWDCTTGLEVAPPAPVTVPGCDVRLAIPAGSVVGAFVADAPAYSAPGVLVTPAVTFATGKTAWVLGQDASGQYYKIAWACSYLWVPKASMGPNFDKVWNGTPLPTGVVS